LTDGFFACAGSGTSSLYIFNLFSQFWSKVGVEKFIPKMPDFLSQLLQPLKKYIQFAKEARFLFEVEKERAKKEDYLRKIMRRDVKWQSRQFWHNR
jgi:hypothetical protein